MYNLVENFPAVLEILPQVLRGDFFLTHTVDLADDRELLYLAYIVSKQNNVLT